MHLKLKTILACTTISLVALISCRTNYPVTKEQFAATKRSESLERGRNLAYNVCGGCHYNPATYKFTGRQLLDIPKIAGKVYTTNLTHSKEYGIGAYTDAELSYLIKTGINRQGHFVPYMLRPNIADEDLNDLIVFLRSDDPSVASSDVSPGSTHLNPIGKMGVRMVAKRQPYIKDIPRPDENNPVAYGKYLVDITGCFHCHSKKATSVNFRYPEKTKGYLAGGAKSKTPAGKVRGSNLTFDKETGIGDFTRDQFRNAVQHNKDRNGSELRPPMEAFPLTDKQSDAIYAYLRSLPPKHHRVKRS